MKEHGLRQADLPELGSPRAVAEILRGKRELNAGTDSRRLASRFPRLASGVHSSSVGLRGLIS